MLSGSYQRIKIKIKPGWDVEAVERVRSRFGDIPLMVDANGANTLADGTHLARLDDYDLMMIEQPLEYDDICDHARLQERIRTPVCLDESRCRRAATLRCQTAPESVSGKCRNESTMRPNVWPLSSRLV